MQKSPEKNQTLTNAAIVIIVGVLATTLAQPQVLGRIPLQNMLKNELHVSRSSNSAFFFWMGLAWYFKPFAGILTDAFPLFGSRRKTYILFSTTLCSLSWFWLLFTPHQYNQLLAVCIVINTFMVIASTVVGGYMVEIAQAVSGSGRLTAIRQFVQQVCTIINGPSAGYLASIAFGYTAAACGGVMFLLVPAALLFLYERRKHINSRELLDNAGKQLVKIGKAKTMWAAAGLMALFYIAPGFGTALFYRQQNQLHMTTESQGFLAMLGGIAGVVAALGYGYICRRLNLRTLLLWGLLIASVVNLGYMYYSSFARAQYIDSLNGFGYSLAELALMDLAVRATPAGSEGLGFALMMSVRNLALFGTDWFGSKLMDQYHLSFNSLVVSNTITTLVAVPLVLLLPRVLINKTDASGKQPAPAPAASESIAQESV